VFKKHIFHQAVQKRSWFDKLTMTVREPVLSLPKEGTQRNTADGRFSTACQW